MKFSYHWLRELSGTEKSPRELADLIMFHAFEVESVEPFVHGLDGVVVGLVESVSPHPDADRLRVTTVITRENDAARTIVCGAPNVAVGLKVAVALPGAKLPNGSEIGEAKIRGIASSGMICAEDELGLGSGHEGILVLPDDAPIGAAFADYAGLSDTILDVNILPNRGCDAISHFGLAREIAALEGRRLERRGETTLTDLPASDVPVSIESDRCRRYVGVSFEGASSGSSPLWIRSALLRCGLRPISLVVDITNYCLLLFGQPMHAFDADAVSGGIVVRQATEGETLELLDKTALSLSVEDLVIADRERALALAGVMGGSRSGISPDTKRVFLEVATFDPSSIRRTVVRHRIPTDASYRFERNVDTVRATDAAAEAISLFGSEGGAMATGLVDVSRTNDEPVSVRFSPSVFRNMFGSDIPLQDAKSKLECLGVTVTEAGDEWVATVPTYRPDLRDGWDFAEEVGRMIGYDAFPSEAPLLPLSAAHVDGSVRFVRELGAFLAASGWDEVRTYSFYSDADGRRLGPEMGGRHIRLSNPMNPDQASLRASLLPTSLRKAGENLRYLDSFRFFEIGSRYFMGADGKPEERKTLSLVLVPKKGQDAFLTLKGYLRKLAAFAGLSEVVWEPVSLESAMHDHPLFHPTRIAALSVDGTPLGTAGEISPSASDTFGLKGAVVSAQIDLDVLRSKFGTVRTFSPLPRYPYATRDLSFSVPRSVSVGELESAVRGSSPVLRDMEVFDIFEKGTLKNVAFHLSIGYDDRTVTGEEAEGVIRVIVDNVSHRFGATLAS